jgi:hypothetical protein
METDIFKKVIWMSVLVHGCCATSRTDHCSTSRTGQLNLFQIQQQLNEVSTVVSCDPPRQRRPLVKAERPFRNDLADELDEQLFIQFASTVPGCRIPDSTGHFPG